jgi:hypothetical protein
MKAIPIEQVLKSVRVAPAGHTSGKAIAEGYNHRPAVNAFKRIGTGSGGYAFPLFRDAFVSLAGSAQTA